MAIKGYFFNAVNDGGVYDRVYNAEDVTSYLNQIVGSGVFPTPSNQLQVRASTGMEIIVGAGEGWINGHKLVNTADMALTVENADALADRIDRVIFYADFNDRLLGIEIKKGTAAINPTAPALTRTTSRYEMSLATIRVNKQITAITQSMITDTRANSTVCGWVAGLIQQVDTSSLFIQWQTAYSDYFDLVKTELDEFMETLTEELRVNTYVVEYSKTASITSTSSTTIALDMTDYTYDEHDIIFVLINGLAGIEGTDYTVTTSGGAASVNLSLTTGAGITNTVQIRVLKSVIGIEETT